MKAEDRKKMVLAMEYIMRNANDEEVFYRWLTYGVADGDIEYGETDPDQVDDFYINNDVCFANLMDTFLRRMTEAYKSGGLYCDGIVSK